MSERNPIEKNLSTDTDKSFEIAKDIHSMFLQAMEERYKEILGFLGFLLPALSGFVWLTYQYETATLPKSELTFFIGTMATLGVLFWGSIYALAISYRYRYLQASVYQIEESCGAAKYIPRSFKPMPLLGITKCLCLSMAPGILQIHVFFFLSAIISIAISYLMIAAHHWYIIAILLFAGMCTLLVYLFGALLYPRKLNKLINSLHQNYTLSLPQKSQAIIFITGPSGVGKSTLRDYYCQQRAIVPVSAVTTRRQRHDECEVHRTISDKKFRRLYSKGELCLVAQNHGAWYGYMTTEVQSSTSTPILIEVDSKTAILEQRKFNAYIIRIVPSPVQVSRQIIISNKQDGCDDRLRDLQQQTDPIFIEERRKAGDVIFMNSYDHDSLCRFVSEVDSLIKLDPT